MDSTGRTGGYLYGSQGQISSTCCFKRDTSSVSIIQNEMPFDMQPYPLLPSTDITNEPILNPPNESNKSEFLQSYNGLCANLVEFVSRILIERVFFQNTVIPQELLLYLANDLIKTLVPQRKETLSVAKECNLLWKNLRGQTLTAEEQAYQDAPKELDVTGEILNGLKYSSMAIMGQRLFSSITSTVQLGLSEHLPSILGYSGAIFLTPKGLAYAVDKALQYSGLTQEQKALVQPWLNVTGRLALGFLPKVHANETGVHYHYPSVVGSTQTFSQREVSTLYGDSLTIEREGQFETPEGTFQGKYAAEFTLHGIYELSEERVRIRVVNHEGKTVPIEFKKIEGHYGPEIQVRCQDKTLEQHWTRYFERKLSVPALAEGRTSPTEQPQNLQTTLSCKAGIVLGALGSLAMQNSIPMGLGTLSCIPTVRGEQAQEMPAGECRADEKECQKHIEPQPTEIELQDFAKAHNILSSGNLMEDCFACFAFAYKNYMNKAVDKKHIPFLEKLKDRWGRTIFLAAVEDGEKKYVQKLINEGVAVQSIDAKGNNGLHVAAMNGCEDLIPIFFPEVFEIDGVNFQGKTALHLAIEQGHSHIVESLAKKGASLNKKTDSSSEGSFSPAALAVFHGQIECLEKLIKNDFLEVVDLKEIIPGIGTLLHLAIDSSQFLMLEHLTRKYSKETGELLEKNGGKNEIKPLQLAAYLGDLKSIRHLVVQSKADVNARDLKDRTAVHWAALGCQPDSIRHLKHLNANIVTLAAGIGNQAPIQIVPKGTDKCKRTKTVLSNLAQGNMIDSTRPPDFVHSPPENLVFEGGGPKGIAYVGALQAMEKNQALKDVVRVAGTSAGSMTAAFVAVGYKTEELSALLKKDFTEFLDPAGDLEKDLLTGAKAGPRELLEKLFENYWEGWQTLFNPKQRAKEFYRTLTGVTGLCEGEKLRAWIEEMIKDKTKTSHCTFRELHDLVIKHGTQKFKDLYVYAIRLDNIDGSDLERFSYEDSLWKDLVISDAIRSSSSYSWSL